MLFFLSLSLSLRMLCSALVAKMWLFVWKENVLRTTKTRLDLKISGDSGALLKSDAPEDILVNTDEIIADSGLACCMSQQ